MRVCVCACVCGDNISPWTYQASAWGSSVCLSLPPPTLSSCLQNVIKSTEIGIGCVTSHQKRAYHVPLSQTDSRHLNQAQSQVLATLFQISTELFYLQTFQSFQSYLCVTERHSLALARVSFSLCHDLPLFLTLKWAFWSFWTLYDFLFHFRISHSEGCFTSCLWGLSAPLWCVTPVAYYPCLTCMFSLCAPSRLCQLPSVPMSCCPRVSACVLMSWEAFSIYICLPVCKPVCLP